MSMIYSSIKKSLIIVAATFSTAFAFAAVPNGSLLAQFNASDESPYIKPDEVCLKDGLSIELSGSSTLDDYLYLTDGQQFTIKAPIFKNIYKVRIIPGDFFAETSEIRIISAEGDDVDSLDQLGVLEATPESTQTTKYADFIFPDVRLSEITFESTGKNQIASINVYLDVEPKFESEGPLYVYADETVPFIKSTNVYPYKYYISTDTEIIEPTLDDMIDVPEEGIKMGGKTPGKYMLYVDCSGDINTCMRHIEVKYDADPRPSTEINIITESAATEYFDLAGRKITNQTKGYQIRKINGIVEKILR